MSVVRLLVMGVVRMYGQAHGYAVHRELVAWRVDTWTLVKPGSIYHALKQLAKEKKLRSLGWEGSDEGPGRERYELTPEGEAEFFQLLEAALKSPRREELGAGIAFMQTLTRPRALELLREQHRQSAEITDYLRSLIPNFPDRAQPPHTQDLLELWSDGYAATATWTEGVIRRLEAGEYAMAGEGPSGSQ